MRRKGTDIEHPGHITTDVRDGIALVRLVNPQRSNAISTRMWRELGEFAAGVAARADVRVVMVSGEGSTAFSAGADISDFDSGRADVSQAQTYDDMVEATCRAFEAIAQPTIAVIRGHCIGAGASLAASCDLRVAADDAYFAVPAAKLGLGYDPRGVERFVRVFGANATRLMLYTAGRFPAARAHAMGAVHALAPTAALADAAHELARDIAAKAPLTLRAAKTAIRAHTSTCGDEVAQQAGREAAMADASEDYAEGRRAFAEKRPPRFSGR